MTFEIEVGGRIRTVSVTARGAADASGGTFTVTMDGEPVEVEARATALGLSLLFADGRQVDVALVDRQSGTWVAHLPAVSVEGVVDGRRRRRGAAGAASVDGRQTVAAPMPGRVVKVLVKPGDVVADRQGLIVIEAMKMENELRSPKAGTVVDVPVAEGDSVESGRALVVVE